MANGTDPPAIRPAVHFVSFRDDRYWNAVLVWGRPDFIHPTWDRYAAAEVAGCDTVIFATGEHDRKPRSFSTNGRRDRRQRNFEEPS
ncbi:hypothetical protein [Altererythrobacter aquiaggeris]|uniref:hypothetical protein n=1 Tax=Aestuarierythrobacter aquiaggeris TaxID=1898396 RepID=UPI003016F547